MSLVKQMSTDLHLVGAVEEAGDVEAGDVEAVGVLAQTCQMLPSN